MGRGENRIPSLDGIRALSFFLVFLGHSGAPLIPGGFGVTVFFFLSGFLITTLLRAEFETAGAVSLKNFYLRRALRILPPFYLVLIGITGFTLAYPLKWPMTHLALASLFLHFGNYWNIWHGIIHMPVGAAVYWSLAVEEHFYLLFPMIFILMQRLEMAPRNQAVTLWTLCALVLAWRLILVHQFHAGLYRTMFGTDTRFDSLLFGCALAVWHNPSVDRKPTRERTWKWIVTPAALVVLAATFLIRNDQFRDTLRYSLQGIALTFLFITAVSYPTWGAMKVLNTRPMVYLGGLSYSLYLVHYAALQNLGRLTRLPHVVVVILALAVSIIIAWSIYEGIEKPCAVLRQRLKGKKVRASVIVATAS